MRKKSPKIFVSDVPNHKNICLVTTLHYKIEFEDVLEIIENIDILPEECDTIIVDDLLRGGMGTYRFIKIALDEHGFIVQDSPKYITPDKDIIDFADHIILTNQIVHNAFKNSPLFDALKVKYRL